MDKKEGYGVLTWPNGIKKYEGEWKNDLYEGKGKYTEKEGYFYEGEYKNGKRHG